MKEFTSYQEFLSHKKAKIDFEGFAASKINNSLFPFQKSIVTEAMEKGRFAIFADCGLGKTLMQLEFANQVARYTNKPSLIVCPLAVLGQTLSEARKFGYSGVERFGVDAAIQLVNYDQLDNVEPYQFAGVVLDESSILKNFEGAYRNLIINNFNRTPFKLACTATPAPNDPMELGNHSEFLGAMTRQEMLSMFFVHDGGETSKWRLKGHAVSRFYEYVRRWAVMLTKPSDLGFSDEGYCLPPLNYIEHKIYTQCKGISLFNDVAVSATEFNAELRRTMNDRMARTAAIVNSTDESFIIWIKQNEEGQALRKLLPDAVEVQGSDTPEYKERMLLGFAEGKFRRLITKTSIASYGLNYQNCHNQIFPSLDFSFEKLYQAIRRSYRFGQQQPVNIHLITTDTMRNVIESIKRKQQQFEEMQMIMSKAIAA
jgi:hypothetical protein